MNEKVLHAYFYLNVLCLWIAQCTTSQKKEGSVIKNLQVDVLNTLLAGSGASSLQTLSPHLERLSLLRPRPQMDSHVCFSGVRLKGD